LAACDVIITARPAAASIARGGVGIAVSDRAAGPATAGADDVGCRNIEPSTVAADVLPG
jgi:hypothetical protein